MREMKDSGIPWIGEIPSDWKILRLKQLLANGKDAIKVGPFGSQLSGSDFTNDGFWVYNQQTVINHDFSKNDTFINHEKFNAMKSFQVRASDILITTRGTIGKICRIAKNFHEGIIHPCIIKFRIDDTKILYNIIEMLFNNSDLVKNQLNYMSNATTIDVIYSSTLKNIYIPVAPIKVQRRIADYLDTKCARIDFIKKNMEAEIEALKQYKQSVITEAVTKGLNKNVKMKDSGIPWIGKIPKDWKVCPLKYLCSYNNETLPENTNSEYEFDYVDIGSVTYGKGIENYQHLKFSKAPSRARRLVKKGDVILSTVRTYLKATAQIPENVYPIVVSTGYLTLRAKEQIIPNFLKYSVQQDAFISEIEAKSSGVSYPAINAIEAVRTNVIVPPIYEQQRIADYLDSKCSKIDSIIQKKQELLANLDTYKKSLIYEYVTGKKEVPSA
jgi:type I restriction enzyme, S subunit